MSHFDSSKKQLKHITKHNKYTEKQDRIKKLPIVVTNKMFRLQQVIQMAITYEIATLLFPFTLLDHSILQE